MSTTADPTPAELFAESARVIRSFERLCLQAGHSMDTIKGIVMLPLTVEQRRLVMEVLVACEGFDQVRDAVANTTNELRKVSKEDL